MLIIYKFCYVSAPGMLSTGGGCGVFRQLFSLHTNHDLQLTQLTRRCVYTNVRKKCDAAHSRGHHGP